MPQPSLAARLTSRSASTASRALAAAAAFAAAELGVTLIVGRFFEWGRAENLLFLAFRPWLILAAALLVAARPWQERLLFYALAFPLAAAVHAALLAELGASEPWAGAGRAIVAGLAVAAIVDALVAVGRRRWGRKGTSAAAALVVLLLALPFGLARVHEEIALGDDSETAAAQRPVLHLLTALPIVWGEAGPFDPASRPAQSFVYLQREFDVRAIDALTPETLSEARLLLAAQPRLLAPEELVAFDRWVRGGGRALILTDPALAWPSDLPPGDVRRAPPVGLLGPLLAHWGVALEPSQRPHVLVDRTGGRRLALGVPGRFRVEGGDCETGPDWRARCRIGAGEAMLVADADLLHDLLWMAPAEGGAGRAARLADNPLVVADWLDRLAGIDRPRVAGAVQWRDPEAPAWRAVLAGLAVAGLALLLALGLRLFARRR